MTRDDKEYQFKRKWEPPGEPEQIRAGFDWIRSIREKEPYFILLSDNPERQKLGEQLADALDFKATVLRSDEEAGFKLEVRVNLPIEPVETKDDCSSVMIFTSSRCRTRIT